MFQKRSQRGTLTAGASAGSAEAATSAFQLATGKVPATWFLAAPSVAQAALPRWAAPSARFSVSRGRPASPVPSRPLSAM